WLYGTARRIALRLRADAGHRRIFERRTAWLLLTYRQDQSILDPANVSARDELLTVLDEELARLPKRYLAAIVLCDLEGKTHEEAARELGWPAGSMSRHLKRARSLLREQLVRRGMGLSAALLATLVEEKTLGAAIPAKLVDVTVKAALSF